MLDLNRQLQSVGQLLIILFHEMGTATITPPAITAKNDPLGMGIVGLNRVFPPIFDIVAGKFRHVSFVG